MKKIAVIVIGESGSGKSWLEALLERRGLHKCVSHTTRSIREKEINGVHYYYVSEEEWSDLELIENTTFGGKKYGVTAEELDKGDNDVILVVEPNGASEAIQFIKENRPNMATFVVFFDIPLEMRIENMRERGDSEEMIAKRIEIDDIAERMAASGIVPNITITKMLKRPDSYVLNLMDLYRKNIN